VILVLVIIIERQPNVFMKNENKNEKKFFFYLKILPEVRQQPINGRLSVQGLRLKGKNKA